ncbi:MAG: PH domain-containing protein [Limisphaerales bacterium]
MSEPPVMTIFQIERPHAKLMTYYFITCLLTGPLFPILILPAYFRYHTMRYRFDEEGVSLRWGILFRREIILNYARIQDTHLSSNVIERWLGLARIQIQTASGSSAAEMTLEGLLEFEAVRDFLYSKMRGRRETPASRSPTAGEPAVLELSSAAVGELAGALREVTAELRQLRGALTSASPPPPSPPP